MIMIAAGIALTGCVTAPYPDALYRDVPYPLLSVDESMSCDALTSSFMFSARRAARLSYWLEVGPIDGFGYARYEVDAPQKLRDEFRRMDALSDQQRYKGCLFLEPNRTVADERLRLQPAPRPPVAGPVLRVKG